MPERDPTVVEANQRYASAHQEIVARIQSRDLAVAGFVTLAGTLITIAVTKPAYALVAVAVGFVALAATLLSCHHDIMVGHLGLFQHRLCKSEQLGTNWFSHQHAGRLRKARTFRDCSFGFLVFVVGVVSLFISYSAATANFVKTLIWVFSLISLAPACYYIVEAHRVRNQLLEEMGQPADAGPTMQRDASASEKRQA